MSFPDTLVINYQGIITEQQYALTITSRKKFSCPIEFRTALYEFLSSIGYRHAIKGFMEFHNQKSTKDKVHAHGVTSFGNPPKNNKKNPFTFKLSKMETPHVWDAYCKKAIHATLETIHNIKTGLINYYKKPTCLFDDNDDGRITHVKHEINDSGQRSEGRPGAL